MALMDTFRSWVGLPAVRHSGDYPLAFQDWVNMFTFNGNTYGIRQTLTGDKEYIEGSFEGLVQGAYRDNGVIFACMLARQLLFSEARFQFRQMRRGRPGDLFGNQELSILEHPWPNATTGDLLTKMIQHADIAGNAYVVRRNRRLKILRPDWVTILSGSEDDATDGEAIDSELIGYLYHPGGRNRGNDPVALVPEEVCHFAPVPDPASQHIGMSWITPVLREVLGDKAATNHKQRFFENGATVNLAVKLDLKDLNQFNMWVDAFEAQHKGTANAYKTLYLGAGATPFPVGADMKQVDFKQVQGAGETRIAAAAGVPPVIVGLSEGLQAATYSNYGQARRRFADLTMRPLWRNAAGSLQSIIPVPEGSELWYDDRDIPFLAEDVKDRAEVQAKEAQTMRTLVDAGWTADSVKEAVTANDWERLEHSGLFSVQLQPPGTSEPEPEEPTDVAEQAGRNLTALLNLQERKSADA